MYFDPWTTSINYWLLALASYVFVIIGDVYIFGNCLYIIFKLYTNITSSHTSLSTVTYVLLLAAHSDDVTIISDFTIKTAALIIK